MPTLATPNTPLSRFLEADKLRLEQTELPIVTVSASFKEDLKGWYGLPEDETLPDVVFSRAHYSMAVAIASQVWGKEMDASKAWLVDPTNYVTSGEWSKILLTEFVGKTIARQPILKAVKDTIDKFGRNKLPILKSITPSLLYMTENITKPILSMHIASGNVLAEAGKTVVQVVTDPHVRPDYLNNAEKSNMTFCVFDEKTKIDFLELAALLHKEVDPDRVIVTGPPIDPRVIAARTGKKPWTGGKLKLCLTTGGLGTNRAEIQTILAQLLPALRRRPSPFQVILYTGTQKDLYEAALKQAKEEYVSVGKIDDEDSDFRILYHPQIVDANELLIRLAFPWADGFITKPSGDMAYDAVAAGCFLLTLNEWGEWEHNIRELFEQQGIARRAKSANFREQCYFLTQNETGKRWILTAMLAAKSKNATLAQGSKKIAQIAI
ncbi:MAG: hypothetical protein M3Q81_00315 [bacterium]|nr:hypothetical protein [bacterium]